jgi:hypothetical protein
MAEPARLRPRIPAQEDLTVAQVVQTYLVGAVDFGSVTVRYQNGRPWQIERLEITRLKEEERPA